MLINFLQLLPVAFLHRAGGGGGGGGAFPELTLRKGPFQQKIQPSLPKTSLLLPPLALALTVEF